MVLTTNSSVGGTHYFLTGLVLTASLFGISTLQTLYYLSRFKRDPIPIIISAISAWLLGTAHAVVSVDLFWTYIRESYEGDNSQIEWSFKMHAVVSISTAFLIEQFYAIWIWKFSCLRGHWIIPVLVLLVSWLGNAFSVVFLVKVLIKMDEIPQWAVCTDLGIGIFKILFVAVIIIQYLMKRPVGFYYSSYPVVRYFRYMTTSGILPGAFLAASLVCFIMVTSSPNASLLFSSVSVNLYATSYLALLNIRSAQPHHTPKHKSTPSTESYENESRMDMMSETVVGTMPRQNFSSSIPIPVSIPIHTTKPQSIFPVFEESESRAELPGKSIFKENFGPERNSSSTAVDSIAVLDEGKAGVKILDRPCSVSDDNNDDFIVEDTASTDDAAIDDNVHLQKSIYKEDPPVGTERNSSSTTVDSIASMPEENQPGVMLLDEQLQEYFQEQEQEQEEQPDIDCIPPVPLEFDVSTESVYREDEDIVLERTDSPVSVESNTYILPWEIGDSDPPTRVTTPAPDVQQQQQQQQPQPVLVLIPPSPLELSNSLQSMYQEDLELEPNNSLSPSACDDITPWDSYDPPEESNCLKSVFEDDDDSIVEPSTRLSLFRKSMHRDDFGVESKHSNTGSDDIPPMPPKSVLQDDDSYIAPPTRMELFRKSIYRKDSTSQRKDTAFDRASVYGGNPDLDRPNRATFDEDRNSVLPPPIKCNTSSKSMYSEDLGFGRTNSPSVGDDITPWDSYEAPEDPNCLKSVFEDDDSVIEPSARLGLFRKSMHREDFGLERKSSNTGLNNIPPIPSGSKYPKSVLQDDDSYIAPPTRMELFRKSIYRKDSANQRKDSATAFDSASVIGGDGISGQRRTTFDEDRAISPTPSQSSGMESMYSEDIGLQQNNSPPASNDITPWDSYDVPGDSNCLKSVFEDDDSIIEPPTRLELFKKSIHREGASSEPKHSTPAFDNIPPLPIKRRSNHPKALLDDDDDDDDDDSIIAPPTRMELFRKSIYRKDSTHERHNSVTVVDSAVSMPGGNDISDQRGVTSDDDEPVIVPSIRSKSSSSIESMYSDDLDLERNSYDSMPGDYPDEDDSIIAPPTRMELFRKSIYREDPEVDLERNVYGDTNSLTFDDDESITAPPTRSRLLMKSIHREDASLERQNSFSSYNSTPPIPRRSERPGSSFDENSIIIPPMHLEMSRKLMYREHHGLQRKRSATGPDITSMPGSNSIPNYFRPDFEDDSAVVPTSRLELSKQSAMYREDIGLGLANMPDDIASMPRGNAYLTPTASRI